MIFAGACCLAPPAQGAIQSSSFKLGARSNSRLLWVTSECSEASAIAAMRTSYGLIRWLLFSRLVRVSAEISAAGALSGRISNDAQKIRRAAMLRGEFALR